MGSFKRAFFGYRRPDVDAAVSNRDGRIRGFEKRAAEFDRQVEAMAELEAEMTSLSGMVIEREREIRGLIERLQEANERHDRSISSLETVSGRLEEIQAQARGQATRIRMKALREAVEVSRRVQALTEAEEEPVASGNGSDKILDGLFEGDVKLEIGPLGDFSQLVGFEDAVGQLGASDISVERFSEGRATLSMRLNQPVELLRELEELSALDFKVRHTAPDNLILDIDEDPGPEQRAA
jgi:DNA repair exonuclease SbcCD ATPase subunit